MEVNDSTRLDAISGALYLLLKGQIPEQICISDKNDEINQVGTFVNRLISEQKSLLEETLNLSKGALSTEITSCLPVANGLKSIQAALKHLTWQTKQIASGDLGQRTDFLGEFSTSFNWMVDQLESSQSALMSEINERSRVELKLRNAYDQMETLVEERTKELKAVNVALEKEIKEKTAFQEALRESEEMFKAIAVSAIDAIILMDDGGRILYWNKASEEMFQYKNNEAIGRNLHHLLASKKHHEGFHKNFSGFVASGAGHAIGRRLELEAIKKDQKRFPIELSLSSVKIKNRWHAVGTVRDISEHKEKELLEKRLAKSQKMEAIGTLAGGIAHDFNNILSAILGYTELALVGIQKESPLEDALYHVRKAGERARDLVKQILTVARQSDNVMTLISVAAITKEALKLMRSSLPATVEIKQKIESTAFIMGDPTQIHQIIMNLCTNASHAVEEKGGVVDIRVSDVILPSGSNNKIIDLKPGNYIKLIVSDNGAGIPDDVIKSIFEPYFTTKNPGEGTGLGLAIVHGIVKTHGGDITVDTMLGKGTRFTVYLPTSSKINIKKSHEEEVLPRGNEHILFVDDEASIADLNEKLLSHLGYSVTVCTSSIEALDLFCARPDQFDLVITDMTMPNMTGDILAARLKAAKPGVPVIICTGYSKKISDELAATVGIDAVCQKPMSMKALSKIIRRVLDA